MRVSVVVPVKNGEAFIGELLESLLNQEEKPYEIIVVDDGSTDRTVEVVKKYPVKLLFTDGSRGANAGRNIGLKNASGDIVAFIDADCAAPPEWIKTICEELREGTAVCVGGSAFLNPKLKGNIIAEYSNDAFFAPMPTFKKRDFITRENLISKRLPNSNNMAVVREVLVKEGLWFDEGFKGGAEEIEILWRLLERGYKILVSNKLYVYHYHRSSLRKLLKQVHNYGRGLYWFFRKHKSSPIGLIPATAILTFYTLFFILSLLSALTGIKLVLYFLLITIALPVSLLFFYYRLYKHLSLKKTLLYPFFDILLELSYSLGFVREFIVDIFRRR